MRGCPTSAARMHASVKFWRTWGFRWDDYRKAYQSTFYNIIPCIAGMSQSMEYRARIVRAMERTLRAEGIEGFYVETWTD